MDINNIALVRATNIIPYEGMVRPLSNVPYLCKRVGTDFSGAISNWLKEEGITPKITPDVMFSEKYDEVVKKNSRIVKEYLPYTADYNSMVLFSLNGICPDDNENGFANNTFSNKKVGVIEPLKYHIDDVVSLHPTDTAIKGDVILSEEAIILINEAYFNELDDIKKSELNKLNLKVKLFNGSLKDTIKDELENNPNYSFETLSLSRASGGFVESATSNELKNNINNIATNYQLPQTKFFNLLMEPDPNSSKYDQIKDEVKNFNLVYDYYMQLFLKDLLMFIGIEPNKAIELSTLKYSNYLLEVIDYIKKLGVSDYKKYVDAYNHKLEQMKITGDLLTPAQIVNGFNDVDILK